MQRIIPFGRDYAQSAEFSVDEGQTIRFWLVREDYTTTPGEHAFAELQIKSAVGNDHWTTVHVMDGDKPYHDLIGVDENLIYRWVRKDNQPVIAVDRASDGAHSRTQRAPVDPRQPDFNAATPVIFKALAETSGDFVGFHYDFQNNDPAEFGEILGQAPYLISDPTPTANSFIKLYRDTDADALVIEFFEEVSTGGAGNTDWSEYDGGRVGIATECNTTGGMWSTSWNISAADITDNGFALNLTGLGLGLDATLADRIANGKTFFVFLMKPGQTYPNINLGPRTGRFTLDQNDLPARLTASPFDTSTEQVALSAVEGNVVIPLTYNEDGDPIRLMSTFRGYTIVAPGEYQWERSCNSSPGVYLNTGWRA